jgi:IS5 family transposase
VEHPLRVIKRQFGFTTLRFPGLEKNTAQLVTLFALSNLWMARQYLMTTTGEVRLKYRKWPLKGLATATS